VKTESANGQDNCLSQFARFLAIGAQRVITGRTQGQQATSEGEASVLEATSNDTTPEPIQHGVGPGDSPAERAQNVGANCEQTARSNGGEESPKTPAQQAPSENTELQGRLDL